ncbi:MAG: phosphoglycerate kinase [Pseudohongiellaceae bacterium]
MPHLKMKDLDLNDRTILIRVDLNVPIKDGKILNDDRVKAVLPTIRLAAPSAKKIILMSHLGRPIEGEPIDEQMGASLFPIAKHLSMLLGCDVPLVDNYLNAPELIEQNPAQILLLENVRINKGEKSNLNSLAQRYAELCDLFVMDAFGTAHRAQASTHGVARYAPVACAGPLLVAELHALEKSLSNPSRPLMAIVGGSKVSTKLHVLESLANKVDKLILGGGIANTFLAACGANVGRSLYEKDFLESARKIMELTSVPLPSDVVTAKSFSKEAMAEEKVISDIKDDDIVMDVGPETRSHFGGLVREMNTLIWNGPLGVFEFPQFAKGTESIALAVAKNEGFSIVGGGETVTAIDHFSVRDKISYISTGGGAFLEYVEGIKLPAVQILEERVIGK